MSSDAIVDRFYATLTSGDLDGAEACFASGAQIWHSNDCKAATIAEARPLWDAMLEATTERGIADQRRSITAKGCVQEHVFWMRLASGERVGMPCCVIVEIGAEGLIAHINEYIDLKSVFPIAEGVPVLSPNRP